MKHNLFIFLILALLSVYIALETENNGLRRSKRYRRSSIIKKTSRYGRCCTSKCVKRCLKSFSVKKCTKHCEKFKKRSKKSKKYNKKSKKSLKRSKRNYKRSKNYSKKSKNDLFNSKKIQRKNLPSRKLKAQSRSKMRKQLILYYPHYHPRYYYQFVPYWNIYYYYSYYPFYYYYWYFFPEYHNHFPFYYSYYYNYWPYVHYFWYQTYYHGIVLSTGQTFTASVDDSSTTVTKKLKSNKYLLTKCKSGPSLVFKTTSHGHTLRFFMGDVNDLINIECLYLMDAVVSVGKFAHVDNLVRIFVKPERKSQKVIKKLPSPFTNAKIRPSKPKKTVLNRNLSKLSFKVGDKKGRKSLLFLHMFNRDFKKGRTNLIRTLAKRITNKQANVLYIVDHLQSYSQDVFKRLLVKYSKLPSQKIKYLKYKKRRIFNK